MAECEKCSNNDPSLYFYWHGDIEEDYDMGIYDCLCTECFNQLNSQGEIRWNVKNS